MELRERESIKRVVPDTSAIIAGVFTEWYEKNLKKASEVEILLSRTVIAEIENLTNRHSSLGLTGLRELRKLEELIRETHGIGSFRVVGKRPNSEEISLSLNDALIRDTAQEYGATLLTCDRSQADLAIIENIETIYFKRRRIRAQIEDFFDDGVMSVHLKEDQPCVLKVGKPGSWMLKSVGSNMSGRDLDEIAGDLVERARSSPRSFIEIDKPGCSVVQLENIRIVVARPPFSEGTEITAVRPLVKLEFPKDYSISASLLERFSQAEGILISGSPGAGKSTFAAALAEFYAEKNKIVKTLEKPRDLQLGPHITQYTSLGTMAQTADILLLVRPDYVIYDELRTTDDFRVFADMRLAGVGLVGVVHSTSAIDSIQRFLGRIDLGLIPSIVDTIVHIEGGEIATVYSIKMTVKVPWGIEERDLARPVVVISDFETNRPLYEIYVFGEQTVVIPISDNSQTEYKSNHELTSLLNERISSYANEPFIIRKSPGRNRFVVEADHMDIGSILGKKGHKIRQIEEELRIRIDLREKKGDNRTLEPSMVQFQKKQIMIELLGVKGEVIVQSEGQHLGTFTVGRKQRIRIAKESPEGKILQQWLRDGRRIKWQIA